MKEPQELVGKKIVDLGILDCFSIGYHLAKSGQECCCANSCNMYQKYDIATGYMAFITRQLLPIWWLR